MAAKLPSGASLVVFETLDSTNLEAKRRAAVGERGPQWIIALEQTSGYGRRGSSWQQAPGDVAATLLFDPLAKTDLLGQLSFAAAVAVAEAIRHFAPRAPLSLKWPNDVLAGGAKIAGLLLELIERRAGAPPLVGFGAGVNIVSKPQAADYPTARLIDLMDADAPPSPKEFVSVLDAAFDRWLSVWRRDGFEPVRAAWLDIAASKGEKICVQLPNETVEGVFMDLDKSGALVLECEEGCRLITAGAIIRT